MINRRDGRHQGPCPAWSARRPQPGPLLGFWTTGHSGWGPSAPGLPWRARCPTPAALRQTRSRCDSTAARAASPPRTLVRRRSVGRTLGAGSTDAQRRRPQGQCPNADARREDRARRDYIRGGRGADAAEPLREGNTSPLCLQAPKLEALPRPLTVLFADSSSFHFWSSGFICS